MFLVDNECTKLTASWLDALGIALIAAGAFAPAAAWLYGLSKPAVGWGYLLLLALGCLAGGFGLHVAGRVFLGRLRE